MSSNNTQKSYKPRLRRRAPLSSNAIVADETGPPNQETPLSSMLVSPSIQEIHDSNEISTLATAIDSQPIVIVDVEKDDFLIDLTKEIDTDIAVIHEIKKNPSVFRGSTMFKRSSNQPIFDSTIVIDDDNISRSDSEVIDFNNRAADPTVPTGSNPRTSILQSDFTSRVSNNISSVNRSSSNTSKRLKPSTASCMSQLAAATSSSVNSSNQMEKKTEPCCPICLENLDEIKMHNKTLMVTFCGHIMCNQCVDQHFKANQASHSKNITCPTCRSKIARNKIHGLYI